MKQSAAGGVRPSRQQRIMRMRYWLRQLFIPTRHNHYRPHLLRSGVVVLFMVVSLLLVGGHRFSGEVQGAEANLTNEKLLREANSFRHDNQVAPLHISSQLQWAAEAKLQDMFDGQYWNHTSPSGVRPWAWVVKSGYRYQSAGENLAKNFYDAKAVTQAWYDSPTHRYNLLNGNYQDVGFAVGSGTLEGKDVVLVVAMYGQPALVGAALSSAPRASVLGQTFTSASTTAKPSVIDRIGVSIQAMPAAVLGVAAMAIVLLAFLLVAYGIIRRVPLHHHHAHHHALLKGAGVFVFMVSIVWLYSGGQI